jgi:hypothetical protein
VFAGNFHFQPIYLIAPLLAGLVLGGALTIHPGRGVHRRVTQQKGGVDDYSDVDSVAAASE